jgi:hypothetical protein
MVQGGYMNQAVAFRYLNSELRGTNVAFSSIYVETLWGTVQTPWGIIAFGKRPAPVGMGMMNDGSEITSESLALIVPCGPMTFVAFVPLQKERNSGRHPIWGFVEYTGYEKQS